jgi:phosphonate transport system substrate-binding protein
MNRLRLVSMMAPNADPFYRELAGWLARNSGLNIEIEERMPWQARERMLDRGEAHIGFLCGLAYVRKIDGAGPELELLAAPVMHGRRYAGRPVYFSDVVVRRESAFRTFDDLRGATWAYNEPCSHSGYTLPLSHLARLGAREGYFRRAVQSGSHQNSLLAVARGRVESAAVDSIVLERELVTDSPAAAAVCVVEILGPSPAPPAVVHTKVPTLIRTRIREMLTTMHEHRAGRAVLDAMGVSHFAPVSDCDYDPIRKTDAVASEVRWCPASRRRTDRHGAAGSYGRQFVASCQP